MQTAEVLLYWNNGFMQLCSFIYSFQFPNWLNNVPSFCWTPVCVNTSFSSWQVSSQRICWGHLLLFLGDDVCRGCHLGTLQQDHASVFHPSSVQFRFLCAPVVSPRSLPQTSPTQVLNTVVKRYRLKDYQYMCWSQIFGNDYNWFLLLMRNDGCSVYSLVYVQCINVTVVNCNSVSSHIYSQPLVTGVD